MTNRSFTLVIVLALVLALGALVGCKEEPPPPEQPDLSKVRPKLDKTKMDIAEAQKKLNAASEKLRAEQEAKRAKADGGSQPLPAKE